ncbi:MAG: hypothetical protein H6925_03370 [Holosporaceae bacterium]|nr:MAG: hypothetical protein H6925_03370 [Holosporaceae bacterium]
MVPKFGMCTMMRLGWLIMICAAAAILVQNFFQMYQSGASLFPSRLFILDRVLFGPMLFNSVHTFGHMAGYAGALYSSLQLGGGSVLGMLSAYLPSTVYVLCGSIILTTVLGWLIYEKICSLQ